MKRILLVPLFCLMATIAVGQGYIGPSPNAMAVMRQANVGVNHYTGTPSISIPLAELSGRELGVSLSLSYNSFGHRVQDIASSEGLGWTLAAGGMITRVVRGEPDDLANGFCSPDKSDTEPDLFVFSFMGRSGKFVLDREGEPLLFPFQDLLIKPGICGGGNIWEITDENGIRYEFGSSTVSRENTTYRPVDNSQPAKTYVSTWHLSKVVSLNGTDEINFNYSTSTVTYINYLFTKEDGCPKGSQDVQDISTRITVSSKYLNSIRTSGGTIGLSWDNKREDLPGGRSLAEVKVTDWQGAQVKKLNLQYSYFQSCASDLCKRLRLDAIYDLSPDPVYSFTYNTFDNLPSRDSKDIDYMGLYNYSVIHNNQWMPYNNSVDGSGAYGSRLPSSESMKANLLERIESRGGGYTSFYFQPHQGYFNGQLQNMISGNRIYLIVTADGLGNIQRTWYRYMSNGQSSGILFSLPTFGVELKKNGTRKVLKRYSHSYTEMFDVNGAHIGYSTVEEELEGKGKTVYTFTNYDTYPDLDPEGNVENGSPPFVSLTSRFWERGNPLSIVVMDLQNKVISRNSFEYTFDHRAKKQVRGSKSLTMEYFCSILDQGRDTKTGEYTVVSQPFTLRKKTTEHYDQEDPNNLRKITRVEEYGYDSQTYQLVSTTGYDSMIPSEKHVNINKYVSHIDYASRSGTDEKALAIRTLRDRHAHNSLVEQQIWSERGSTKVLLGATLNLYKRIGEESNKVVPATIWKGEKSSGAYVGSFINSAGQFVQPASFKLAHTYDTYHSEDARLIAETAGDGTSTTYTWAHNRTLPDTITVNPGIYQQMTLYQYRPLVGVVKETDPNRRSTHTEYDHQGRVRLVRDHEGMIRERYLYHYKNETAAFRLSANRIQALTGQTINFTLEDMVLPSGGAAKISWDMANGTVHDDNRQSASQSYSTPGLYTVKAVLFTNEYAPYTATMDMLVSNPMNITLCADGPQWIDLCYRDPEIYGSCTQGPAGPGKPTVFQANFSPSLATGCPGMYTYRWEYRRSTDTNWITINSLTSSAIFPRQFQVGDYQIRCTVTDGCNNTVTATSYVYLYKSSPSC